MADEPSLNEEFADAHNAEMSDEIAELSQKISDLEDENSKIVRENKEYKQRVEELKASVEKLSSENDDLKSENTTMGAVAARAADLEGEVSRLQHDLSSALSDLQDSNAELSGLKKELEVLKGREKEKDVKLEAVEREKALLVVELDARDKQIQVFKKNVEQLEAMEGISKTSESKNNDLETNIEKMKAEISVLQSCLDDKEKVIRELKGRGINGDSLVDGGNKGLIGGLRQREWMVMGGTAIATVAVVGCYMHAARKH